MFVTTYTTVWCGGWNNITFSYVKKNHEISRTPILSPTNILAHITDNQFGFPAHLHMHAIWLILI